MTIAAHTDDGRRIQPVTQYDSAGIEVAPLSGALIGAVTETAPASDTASSGLNGRLQRVAQRLTALIGVVPASLGQKTKAGSLAVAWASDQDVPKPGQTTRTYDWANGQKVTVSGSSAFSAAITGTEAALCADTDCYVRIGSSNPTASAAAGSFYLPAGAIFHAQITSGQQVAAIQKAVGGGLYILPIA